MRIRLGGSNASPDDDYDDDYDYEHEHEHEHEHEWLDTPGVTFLAPGLIECAWTQSPGGPDAFRAARVGFHNKEER